MQKILFILLLVFFKVHVMSISQEFISVCLKDLSQYQNDVLVEKLFIARSQSRYRCYDSAQKRNKPADVIQRPMLSNVSPLLFPFPSLPGVILRYSIPLTDGYIMGLFIWKGPNKETVLFLNNEPPPSVRENPIHWFA